MDALPEIADKKLAAQLQRLLAASNFAKALCRQHPDMLSELVSSGDLQLDYSDNRLVDSLQQCLLGCESAEALATSLRRFRQREMLRIVWRDFNRLVTTMDTMRDTSLLAEACVNAAQRWWYQQLVSEFGEPRSVNGEPQQLLVIAMGKLGARELNLSSDIDLIFTYPEAGRTEGAARSLSNQEFFIKLGQRMIAALDQSTAEGFVFRVDMRLRPYGQSGSLVLNFAAMEEYYQDQGRDWERYALIKARVISGPKAAGEQLMRSLKPFIYRRYIDFGVIDSLRSMKAMINAEVRRRGLKDDVKLGPGGIREIEFIAQCFQLIRGGRSSALRQRELLPVLDALVVEGCLPPAAVKELKTAYLFLRDTEHAIQGYEDRQSQKLPARGAARDALLVAMGFARWEDFYRSLQAHRHLVTEHFSYLIAAPEESEPPTAGVRLWPDAIEADALEQLGFVDGESVAKALLELRDSSRMRHLQAESRSRLDQFMPRLLLACAGHEHGDVVFFRLLRLVQAVMRRSAYLVLLMENPAALDELIRLCAASPWISEQLHRNPVLLDELLDARTLYSAADKDSLRQALRQQLGRLAPDDLEANMEALRYFHSAQVLHIAASEVTGRLPLMQVSDKLTFLAEVILEQSLQLAWLDLIAKYGQPARDATGAASDQALSDTGFAILGYGKLGGIELGYGSDLDLVFVYDATSQGVTSGERSIDNNVFYTRLGQRVIHILDARTAMGQLYEVDMRLRPSGESGMLVTTLAAFREYQQHKAWTWEHQALVRARFITGDPALQETCSELRRQVLGQSREKGELAVQVLQMRNKMREHLLPASAADQGLFHLKQGIGGIVDIEFMVQYAVLAWSQDYPELSVWPDNIRILQTLAAVGLFSGQESQSLIDAYIAYRSVAHQQALQQQSGEVDGGEFAAERSAVVSKWAELLELKTDIGE
jgi:glutamate-ammonia-ligase adenylyltransferase